jgi:hypothetical protein
MLDLYALRSGSTRGKVATPVGRRWESEDMRLSPNHTNWVVVAGLMLACVVAFADGTRFSDITPLTNSVGPAADESTPITFGNPDFRQASIADRAAQLFALKPNSGSWG